MMKTKTQAIDVTPFCGIPDEAYRYAIQNPQHIGNKFLATDGCILIELNSRPSAPEVATKGKFPNAAPILADFPEVIADELPEVEGLGIDDPWWRDVQRCQECGGSGLWDDENDVECEECDGTGNVLWIAEAAFERINVGGLDFGRRYIYEISKLPNVRCHAALLSTNYPRLHFIFDGGRGVLMGMKEETVQ